MSAQLAGLAFDAACLIGACVLLYTAYAGIEAAVRRLFRRAGGQPAPGAEQNTPPGEPPVPGHGAPATAVPVRPAPAPGHGGLLGRTDTYVCGRTITFNYDRGTRLIAQACDCQPDTDWDAAMRRLLS